MKYLIIFLMLMSGCAAHQGEASIGKQMLQAFVDEMEKPSSPDPTRCTFTAVGDGQTVTGTCQ